MRVQLRRDDGEIGARRKIRGFPGFLGFQDSQDSIPGNSSTACSCKLLSASFHLWSILRGIGAHTPIQDLESYESILSMSLTHGPLRAREFLANSRLADRAPEQVAFLRRLPDGATSTHQSSRRSTSLPRGDISDRSFGAC